MLIHDVNPRWIIKPISRAAWRTSWHGNGLFTGSRFTAFNLAGSPRPAETTTLTASHSNPILKAEYRSMRFRVITRQPDSSLPGLSSREESEGAFIDFGAHSIIDIEPTNFWYLLYISYSNDTLDYVKFRITSGKFQLPWSNVISES